jgi:hypothetical protein
MKALLDIKILFKIIASIVSSIPEPLNESIDESNPCETKLATSIGI